MKTLNYSNEHPKAISYTKHLGMRVLTLNYFVEESTGENESNGQLQYRSVQLPAGVHDYKSIVSAIVNNEFNNDEMQAIINNYLLDPEEKEYVDEWKAMQAVRAYAKRIAHQVVDGEITEESLAPFAIKDGE